MVYSLLDFAKSLQVDGCRIQNTPNLIFLCGGKIGRRGDSKPSLVKYKSARDFFYQHLLGKHPAIAQRVKLAEEVNTWFRQTPFPDLLELERYLADLSDITVLFVESPGSIAELGAFSALEVLGRKTLAIINSAADDDISFISDGPVKRIRNYDEELVHYYQWGKGQRTLNSPTSLRALQAMAEYLVQFLERRSENSVKESVLDTKNHGHVLLLLADLLRISGVATSTDLSESLGEMGYHPSREDLHRYLSLLRSIKFIDHQPYGEQVSI